MLSGDYADRSSPIWVGNISSEGAVETSRIDVKDEVGFALFQAQTGKTHIKAKPLKGLGAGVLDR